MRDAKEMTVVTVPIAEKIGGPGKKNEACIQRTCKGISKKTNTFHMIICKCNTAENNHLSEQSDHHSKVCLNACSCLVYA